MTDREPLPEWEPSVQVIAATVRAYKQAGIHLYSRTGVVSLLKALRREGVVIDDSPVWLRRPSTDTEKAQAAETLRSLTGQDLVDQAMVLGLFVSGGPEDFRAAIAQAWELDSA